MKLFVAIEVTDEQVVNNIGDIQSEMQCNVLRPVGQEKLHFTLAFLGDVNAQMAKCVIEGIEKVRFGSFLIECTGIGAFPRPSSPRIIWAGVSKGNDKLKELAGKVDMELAPLGFVRERPFSPHATIFRVKSKNDHVAKGLKRFNMTRLGIQKVDKIKLKESMNGADGYIYRDLASVESIS